MNDRVVDTNVLVVANGRNSDASLSCREASIQFLKAIHERGRIVVDSAGQILAEYRTYCHLAGQPGVGDLFFREILQNYSGKVVRVELARNDDGSFVDFPGDTALQNFDISDRKFVAVAVRSGATVANSTDSDWLIHKEALNRNGINVEFVCSEDRHSW